MVLRLVVGVEAFDSPLIAQLGRTGIVLEHCVEEGDWQATLDKGQQVPHFKPVEIALSNIFEVVFEGLAGCKLCLSFSPSEYLPQIQRDEVEVADILPIPHKYIGSLLLGHDVTEQQLLMVANCRVVIDPVLYQFHQSPLLPIQLHMTGNATGLVAQLQCLLGE